MNTPAPQIAVTRFSFSRILLWLGWALVLGTAAACNGDEDSGEFIDLMQATQELPSAALESEELQRQVQNTVGAMPEHLREILLLSYFHQFPYKQIGEILGIPLGTVKSRLHAAVAHFADRWKANQNRSPGVAS